MRQVKLVMVMLVLFVGLSNVKTYAKGETKTVDIKTSAVCESCEAKISRGLKKVDGVKKSSMNDQTKVVTVTYNPDKTDPDKIRKAITMIGYDADNMKANTEAYDNLEKCCKKSCTK
ncbi:MAG: heavy metal-associated domain-containing protein [Bacteroidota bacterium]